ncbi:MAG: hypothetical protein AAGC47_03130 [Bacteroidota bacterium]
MSGKFLYDKAEEFMQKLRDGTIERQKPDGPEMVRAMQSAKIDNKGVVNWTEECFCPTPLMHERETIYDLYFMALTTKVIPNHEVIEGVSFVDKLSLLLKNSR